MSEEPGADSSRVLELGRAFDQAFAEPARTIEADTLDLLAVQVGGNPYALRLAEVDGLFAGKKVVALPSSKSVFLGLAGLRGIVVPVYSLGGLLGHPVPVDPPRWIVLARSEHILGLAFDEFDGFLRLPNSAVLPVQGKAHRDHVPEAARAPQGLRGLASVRSIVQTLAEDRRRPHEGA